MRGRNHERMPLRGEAPKHAPVHQAPQMWRVPVGPGCGAGGRWQGLAGLRDDAPSEARGADGSRAGRRPPAHKAARPHSKVRRRPEHQRCHKRHGDGPPPIGAQRGPPPWPGQTAPGTAAGSHGDGAIQAERPASSVARCTPPRPASCAAWVRHENPSARNTASGCADRDGSSE